MIDDYSVGILFGLGKKVMGRELEQCVKRITALAKIVSG